MADLLCPKCAVSMRVIERNGVTIERCPECGGIFLDRGELERLAQAENAYISTAAKSRDWRDDDDDAVEVGALRLGDRAGRVAAAVQADSIRCR